MSLRRLLRRAVLLAAFCTSFPAPATALDFMCDPSYEDCRAILLSRITNEPLAIDIAMLFMEDDALADAIIERHNRGVRVRMLVEPRRNQTTPKNAEILARLSAAGIPMRAKASGGVLHWKFMIFDSQNVLQFSAANYSDYYFKPTVPYLNYTDEGIYFTGQGSLVDSFRRRFDDAWVDTVGFYDYGNITSPPVRRYPLYGIDPELSFVPVENFATRSVPHYDAEQERIDVIMYKITEPRHADGLVAAAQRQVPVRLITEPDRYRNPANIWQAYHIDRLYMAGVQIRDRAHAGFLHQKSTLLYGQGLAIFGSSNWTNESNNSQYEHNYFTTKSWFFDWFRDNFERKWTNSTGNVETVPFTPLPPDVPSYAGPANGATDVATSGVTLQWNPGPWSWKADIYFGTSQSPPLFRADVSVGPGATNGFTLPDLTPGTTYYWKIVSKTVADQGASGAVYAFTTAGTSTPPPPPPNVPPSVSLTSPADDSAFTDPATISMAAAASDSDGTVVRVEFLQGSTLLGSDSSAPYQFTWSGVPAGTYALSARAVDDDGAVTASPAVNVTVAAPPPAPSLPSPWQSQDVGAVGPTGTASENGGTYTIAGGGADVWGTSDAFHYVWQRVSGDLDVVARVVSVEYVHAWVKAGVMIREQLTPGSAHAFMLVSPGKGMPFQRRVANGGLSTSTGSAGAAPAWVKLQRRGNTITALRSADGASWTVVASDTFAMPDDVHVGLAVSSHDATRLATATFDHVTVQSVATTPPPNASPSVAITAPATSSTFAAPATVSISASANDTDGTVARVDFFSGGTAIGTDSSAPYEVVWSNVAAGSYTLTARAVDDDGAATTSAPVTITVESAPPPAEPALPEPWASQDIGAVGPAGMATATNGTYTVQGAGADVWGTTDGFHFVWQQVSGDADVITRVASVEYVHAWVKAGVMIREQLTADSPHAFMLVSAGKGYAFQRRIATGGLSTNTSGGTGTAPAWVKLERRANTISAFVSSDGANWTLVGTETFTMGLSAYVGLAVTSHDATRLATATFDNVRVQLPTSAPPPPPPADLGEIVLHAADATAIAGAWRLEPDSTAASGLRAWNPDGGGAKVTTAAASPTNFVELTFSAEAGRPYRLWIRGKAEGDYWSNDSAHVQFSGSVDAGGTPTYRIGTTSSAEFNLESCGGCGVSGWGWEDNGWGAGVLGPVIYFATTGTQRIRLQTREDGLSFDQIVLSADRFLQAPPGPNKSDHTILQKN